ncbi:MAG: tetratricopeptide repeat protein [Bacteroidia bacterium]|jgi:tetratricopeptide (TPR) repeat protein|nr:tetratricopeptide repeat protein [Bacteroidia bacterium]
MKYDFAPPCHNKAGRFFYERIQILLFALLVVMMAAYGCKNTVNKEDVTSESPTDPLELLNQKIEADSTNATLYNDRAKLFLSRSQTDKALMDLNRALELNPSDAATFMTLADAYLMMEKPENVNAALLKAVELAPQDPMPLVKLAELNLMLEQYNTALAFTDRSLEISKFNPEAYFVRGSVFLARKDTVSALRNILLALDQKQDFYEALIKLGVIYTEQRNPLAEQYLQRALKLFPNSLQARYQLALYLQDNLRPEEALQHYDTLLAQIPNHPLVLYNKGYVHLVYLNDYATAIDFFDQALINDPNYVDALYNKGRALEEMGRYVNARDVYNEVLRRRPNHELAVQALNRLDLRK